MSRETEDPVRVIGNPDAGRGRGGKKVELVRAVLAAAGIRFELDLTRGRGHAALLARDAARRGFRAVCAVGGDGTVSEVVNGLASIATRGEPVGPLIALPTGSGNDFAACTGSPRLVDDLPRVIERPRALRLDLLHVRLRDPRGETTRFVDNSLGVGFEARVNRESARIRRLRGLPLYLLAAIRALRDPGAPLLEIAWTAEDGSRGEVSGRFLMATAGNGPRSGGGFYLTPDARFDSGFLELGYVDVLSRRQVVGLLPKALKGRHTSHRAVHLVRCSSFTLSSPDPLPVHADGEFLGAEFQSIEVTVEAGRLVLFT